MRATTHEHWRPDDDGPWWRVAMHWSIVAGRFECIGIDVRSFIDEPHELDDPPMPTAEHAQGVVSTSLVRALPLGQVLRTGRERAEAYVDLVGTVEGVDTDEVRRALEAFNGGHGGRPRQYEADHWAEVARIYRAAWQRGEPPTKTVAEHFTVAKSTAAKWVARCRELGALPETSKGRPNARTDER